MIVMLWTGGTRPWDRWSKGGRAPMIRDLVGNLDKHRFTMPPWCGRDEEADLLADYLYSIAPQRPTGMLPRSPDEAR